MNFRPSFLRCILYLFSFEGEYVIYLSLFLPIFSVTELREDFSPRPVRLLGAGDSLRGRSNVAGDAFSTSALLSL